MSSRFSYRTRNLRCWKSQAKTPPMTQRCFPSPLPWAVYLLAIFGMIALVRRGSPNLVVGIVGPISVQLVWPFVSSTTRAFDGRDRVHQWNRQLRIVDIGTGLDHRNPDTFTIL